MTDRRRVPAGQRKRILARDGDRCVECGAPNGGTRETALTMDHIVPRSRGGLTTDENLQALCKPCNEAKADWGEGEYVEATPWVPAHCSCPPSFVPCRHGGYVLELVS